MRLLDILLEQADDTKYRLSDEEYNEQLKDIYVYNSKCRCYNPQKVDPTKLDQYVDYDTNEWRRVGEDNDGSDDDEYEDNSYGSKLPQNLNNVDETYIFEYSALSDNSAYLKIVLDAVKENNEKRKKKGKNLIKIDETHAFFGDTPTTGVIQRNNLESLKLLVDAGANPSFAMPRSNNTLLMYAADRQYLKIIEYLLEQGADKRAISTHGQTALKIAQIRHEENPSEESEKILQLLALQKNLQPQKKTKKKQKKWK